MQERLLAIVPNLNRKKGLFGQQAFNLLLTDRRIIAVEMTKEMLKAEAKRVAAEVKGSGLATRMAAMASSGINLYKKYELMAPEAALAENPGNFTLERTQLQTIKVKHGDVAGDDGNYSGEVIIKGAGGKMVFRCATGSLSSGEIRNIFRQTYGDIVK